MNYQGFGFNKTTYNSSPNFTSEYDYTKTYPYNAVGPNSYSLDKPEFSSSNYKKIEDFNKDNLSNIEETVNHSFNSGQFKEILQANPPKSHFLDDYELSKQKTPQNYQNFPQSNISQHSHNKSPSDIKSDMNMNIYSTYQKDDEIFQILDANDANDLNRSGDIKNKLNFNEFTIQPDLETRSVYNLVNENKPLKHGPYSMDMNKDNILDSDMQKDVFYDNQPKNYNYYDNYMNISEKKLEKKPSHHHHKGYSGDTGLNNMNNYNYCAFHENEKKNIDYVNVMDISKKNDNDNNKNFEHQPIIKEKTNFIDIFKKGQLDKPNYSNINTMNISEPVGVKGKDDNQSKKALPPLFGEIMKKPINSEKSSPERLMNHNDFWKKNMPPLMESPALSSVKAGGIINTPKIMINGSKFSANQKNIFETELNVRNSITLDENQRPRVNIMEKPKNPPNYIQSNEFSSPKTADSLIYNVPKPQFHDKPMNDVIWKIDQFEMGPCLGRGKFSTVYVARDKRTKFIVALKIIQKKVLKETGAENALSQEIKIQSFCDHPNILKLYGYINEDERIILILEYASHGQLFTELKQQPMKRLEENKAATYVKQVLQAIQYLHHNEIMHRDIKPENIMMSNGVLKLSDFGWAAFCPKNKRRDTFCGTLDYVSPEVVEGHPYDYSVDIWSLGVLCYELCEGQPPFLHESTSETYLNIINCVYQIPQHFSSELKDLMMKIFRKNPEERVKIDEMINHAWLDKSNTNSFIDMKENSIFSKLMNL